MNQFLFEFYTFTLFIWLMNISLNVYGFLQKKYPLLRKIDRQVDSKTYFWGNPVLGESTTWGGLTIVVILGLLSEIILPGNIFFIKALLVFLGHACGSFIKRRLGISRGSFLPFVDHGDYVLVSGIFCLTHRYISFEVFILSLLLSLSITPLITNIFHHLGFRERRL